MVDGLVRTMRVEITNMKRCKVFAFLLTSSAFTTSAAFSLEVAALSSGRATLSLLAEQAGLDHDHAERLLQQHPGLDEAMVRLLITRIKLRALNEGRAYSPEAFMSKFALYASEMVGWRSEEL